MITLYYLLECAESYFERKSGIQKIIFWSVISLIVVSVSTPINYILPLKKSWLLRYLRMSMNQ